MVFGPIKYEKKKILANWLIQDEYFRLPYLLYIVEIFHSRFEKKLLIVITVAFLWIDHHLNADDSREGIVRFCELFSPATLYLLKVWYEKSRITSILTKNPS